MPKIGQLIRDYGTSKEELLERGKERLKDFCTLNGLEIPRVNVVSKGDWVVSACAYYRPDRTLKRNWTTAGISICPQLCAHVAGELVSRNWNWPGSVTDREPYGVIAHELGHHADWSTGERKWTYGSEYCEEVKNAAREPGLTSYAETNPAEWFAEAFRLFVTNPRLLYVLRPRTFGVLIKKWKPILQGKTWVDVLGEDAPGRIVDNLMKKTKGKLGDDYV